MRKRLREQFFDDFRRLARHPLLGQACPEFGENMRIWPIGNYVVLYTGGQWHRYYAGAHGARDLPAIVRKVPPSP